MISAARKSRLVEEYQIPTAGRDELHVKLILPKLPGFPRRLVFVAPLVGASASQALVLFRSLTRRGSIVMSFEYRGHARSSGTFELEQTVADTRYALDWANRYAREHGLPLHGLATCFGTVPLLAQFAPGARRSPLWSLSAISGLFRLDQIMRIEDFARVLAGHPSAPQDGASLLERITRQTLDVDGAAFRGALQEYLTALFPELRVGWDHFEELDYDRVDILRTLRQLSQARFLNDVTVPSDVRCRFYFGRNDHLMDLHTERGRQVYCNQVSSLVPHAELCEVEFDHYGRGPDHEQVLTSLSGLFEEVESDARTFNWTRETTLHRGAVR